jgi:hypothetical protein
MTRLFSFILFISLLSGCSRVRPLRTIAPATTALPYTQCAWTWASQALPELSNTLNVSMRSAGLSDVSVRAEAYGENCINAAGEVDHFATMETDFHITVKVANLGDKKGLGDFLERILRVLDGFPTGKIPGPQPGKISISFQTTSNELNITFTVAEAKSARERGHHGAALLEELQNK